MSEFRVPHLNLAAEPLRNRRFFRTILAGLILVLLFLGGGAAALLVRSITREKAANASAAGLDLRIQAALSERAVKTKEAGEMRKRDEDLVSEVNAVLLRKSFSWVAVLARLEDALPADCRITSISPLQALGGRLPIVFKVSAPGLPEILTLVERLAGSGFKDVGIKSETGLGGRMIAEIGLVHDGSR